MPVITYPFLPSIRTSMTMPLAKTSSTKSEAADKGLARCLQPLIARTLQSVEAAVERFRQQSHDVHTTDFGDQRVRHDAEGTPELAGAQSRGVRVIFLKRISAPSDWIWSFPRVTPRSVARLTVVPFSRTVMVSPFMVTTSVFVLERLAF
jgi:hypothetical protein